jgi:hypothetical protein
MDKLEITDQLIQKVIVEVAPLVSNVTGWDLRLADLRSRVVPRDQGYEAILLGRLYQAGLQDLQELMPDLLEKMIEYLIEQNALAAYMPGAGEILVIRENVDESNLAGLKLILCHELVHRGQHLFHPELFARTDALLREAVGDMHGEAVDLQRSRQIAEELRPIMSLIESHAAYVQQLVKLAYFPDARIETHFNLASLLMRFVGADKLAQYTNALPQVAQAAAAGKLESLYNSLGQ